MEFDFQTIDDDHNRRDTVFAVIVLLLCVALWYIPTGFESETVQTTDYVAAKVIEVDNSNILDFGVVQQGQQEVQLELLSGEFEGRRIASTNVLVGDIQIDYTFQPGDRVLAEVKKNDNGNLQWVEIVGPDRLRVELVLTVIFAIALLLVGGLTGFKAMLSFVFAVLLIWKVLIPCSLQQHDPILVGLAVVGLMTFVINLLIGGLNRKGLIAFLGGMSGILLTCALALLFSPSFSLTGAVRPFAKTLLLKVSGDLDISRIFIAGIFIACSGAVMDLAMDIAAALTEIKKHNPTIHFRPLLLSGLRVGRAVIGTMTTTLLLAYSGGYITMLMYFMAQGLHPKVILNSSFLSAEILNTLIGSFGLVTVAPFTALVGSLLLCRSPKAPPNTFQEKNMIIPVTNKDLIPSVARLAAEIWTEHFTPIIGADQVAYMLQMFQSEEAIAEQINQGYRYFLIDVDGRHTGYFSLQPRDNELHLSKFYIHAAHRGQGLGRRAMTFIEEIAAREGLKKITLVVNKYNHTSIQIYEKLGFKNVAAMVTDIGNDFVMDDYKLEKDLA